MNRTRDFRRHHDWRLKARIRRLLQMYNRRLPTAFRVTPRDVGRRASVRGMGCGCLACSITRYEHRRERRRARHTARMGDVT